jgi:hypothetical protein
MQTDKKGREPNAPARGTAKRLSRNTSSRAQLWAQSVDFLDVKIRGFLAVQSGYVKISTRMEYPQK